MNVMCRRLSRHLQQHCNNYACPNINMSLNRSRLFGIEHNDDISSANQKTVEIASYVYFLSANDQYVDLNVQCFDTVGLASRTPLSL